MEADTNVVRLFLTTPFSDYTVSEGFLLLLFILCFISLIILLFRGRF